jgi:hypothetical protein
VHGALATRVCEFLLHDAVLGRHFSLDGATQLACDVTALRTVLAPPRGDQGGDVGAAVARCVSACVRAAAAAAAARMCGALFTATNVAAWRRLCVCSRLTRRGWVP